MKVHRHGRGVRARHSVIAVSIAATLALAACGTDGGGANGGGTAEATGGCGTFAKDLPPDPDGVLAGLPKDVSDGYAGQTAAVHASPWKDWKPAGPPPYTIGLEIANTATPLGQVMPSRMKELGERSDLVGDVVVRIPNNDVQTEQLQVRSMIRDKVDLIIWVPLSAKTAEPLVDEAAKAGIPVITPLGVPPSHNAVGLTMNTFLQGALTAQVMAKKLDGKGQVLDVHGIPSTEFDIETFRGQDAVFVNCPDIKPVGQIVGGFVASVAKGETLKFLSAHTQPIAGVMQSGGMAPGVIQAFDQAGRDTPIVADVSAMKASLAYWRDHEDTYTGVGAGGGVQRIVDGIWNFAIRMLDGRGLIINQVVQAPPLITADNLDQWVGPDASEQSVGTAEGPEGNLFGDSFLDHFFREPGNPEPTQ